MSHKIHKLMFVGIMVIIAAGLFIVGNPQQARANIASLNGGMETNPGTTTCTQISFDGYSTNTNGYAAVRVWDSPTHYVIDSFRSGYPAFYAPIYVFWWTSPQGFYSGNMNLPAAVPLGKTYTLRVYRALAPMTGSWDNQTYQDKTITCVPFPYPPTPHP